MQRGAAQRLDLRFVGDVGLHHKGAGAERVAFVRDLVQHLEATGGKDNTVATPGEGKRGGATDAAGGAGDDDDAGVVSCGHEMSCR
ncbi:hypothetical protein GCM10011504_38800 [Siccirubricoccus deserti]|nr:hypothetical protein GCM10011504_38800 [Siccirubricoccus deserti]